MTKLDNSLLPTPSRTGLASHIRSIGPSFRQIFRAAARRHTTLAALMEADPHVLKDMGITPQDVQSASAAHWWEDPTDQLARLAGERRAARTQHAAELREAS